jgi:hypothetical protein
LTGIVIDVATSGGRPVPNLRLKVRAAGPTDGAVGGTELADVITDANGRYEITGVTTPLLFVQTAPGSDYKFRCDFYPVVTPVRPDWRFLSDLPVVNASWSGDRLPPGLWWIIGTSVYGTVSERVGEMVQPVGGATVTLGDGEQDPPATTNGSGFYMICSVVGTDQARTIAAIKDGYRSVSRLIFGGWDSRVDLEIGRN